VDGQVAHSSSLAASTAMWLAMVAVMMGPVVAPWVRAYATMVAPFATGVTWMPALPFVAGYAVVWAAYSLAMALLQTGLAASALLADGRLGSTTGSVVLMAAGAFQFTRLKAACLTHCRNPLSFLLARWHDGPRGGLRLGVAHGLYCLGCCGLLMATGFALGVMSLSWMAIVAVVAVVEQVAPAGPLVGRLFGGLLIAAGLWRFS
jgi:predicted metal-binding membrane protein